MFNQTSLFSETCPAWPWMFPVMEHLQLLNSQNTKIKAEDCKKIKGMPFYIACKLQYPFPAGFFWNLKCKWIVWIYKRNINWELTKFQCFYLSKVWKIFFFFLKVKKGLVLGRNRRHRRKRKAGVTQFILKNQIILSFKLVSTDTEINGNMCAKMQA